MRAAKGYPSLPVPADAYDPAEASAPTGKTQETLLEMWRPGR
jgi:hypothetical protein